MSASTSEAFIPGRICRKSSSPSAWRLAKTLSATVDAGAPVFAFAANGVSVASGTATETVNMAAIAMRSTSLVEIMSSSGKFVGWMQVKRRIRATNIPEPLHGGRRREQRLEAHELPRLEVGGEPVGHAVARPVHEVVAAPLEAGGHLRRRAGRGPDDRGDEVLAMLVDQGRDAAPLDVVDPAAHQREAFGGVVRHRRREI